MVNPACSFDLDVSSLSLGTVAELSSPLNHSSKIFIKSLNQTRLSETVASSSAIVVDSIYSSSTTNSPWLPVSKGYIKKCAETRFVNSSPNSYRLMPASVESSNIDRTSFVEKSSHKCSLPVSYFLEVAKLWELSNRSELECTFTIANSEKSKVTPGIKLMTDNDERRPICHAKPSMQNQVKKNSLINKTNAENELLKSVSRFLTTCVKKDKSYVINQDISDTIGSETRRYLNQIVSLMNENFASKLQSGRAVTSQSTETRKRSCCFFDDHFQNKKEKKAKAPCVNILTVPSTNLDESNDDQFVIIHIPTSQKKSNHDCNGLQPVTNSTQNDLRRKEKSYKCFYCPLYFNIKQECAKHMLSHLTSSIND